MPYRGPRTPGEEANAAAGFVCKYCGRAPRLTIHSDPEWKSWYGTHIEFHCREFTRPTQQPPRSTTWVEPALPIEIREPQPTRADDVKTSTWECPTCHTIWRR